MCPPELDPGGRPKGKGAKGAKKGGGGGGESDDANDSGGGSDSDGQGSASASDSDSDSDYDSDEEDEEDDAKEFQLRDDEQRDFQKRIARQGGVGGAQMKTTVRNLRIREDTAKYLRNLDPNSAFYDPKTRSMRENPTPHEDAADLVYAGDNFARINGDAVALAQTQLFAWEAYEHGSDIHPQANPSQSELLQKQFAEKAAGLKHQKRDAVLDKYGGGEHLAAPDARLTLGQSEAYAEYGLDGRVVVTIYDRRRRVGHPRQVVGRALQLAVRRRELRPQHGVRVLSSSGLVS